MCLDVLVWYVKVGEGWGLCLIHTNVRMRGNIFLTALCAKRTLYKNSGLFRAIVINLSYCWRWHIIWIPLHSSDLFIPYMRVGNTQLCACYQLGVAPNFLCVHGQKSISQKSPRTRMSVWTKHYRDMTQTITDNVISRLMLTSGRSQALMNSYGFPGDWPWSWGVGVGRVGGERENILYCVLAIVTVAHEPTFKRFQHKLG